MRSLKDLQTAVIAGIKTGDYSLLDKMLEQDSVYEPGSETSNGTFDPFGVYPSELGKEASQQRDTTVDTKACPPVLGELPGSEPVSAVAGTEQRSSVQRDIQELQEYGSGI